MTADRTVCAGAGVVLCGGASRRMGQPKAWLPFGPETLLQRIVRQLSAVVEPLVVVSAAEQALPELPSYVRRVADRHPDRGPLEGLRVGLEAVGGERESAYVTGCDAPWIVPSVIGALFEEAAECEIVLPHVAGRDHYLAAVYRTSLVPQIESLLSRGERRVGALAESVKTCRVNVERLQQVDPDLTAFRNLNHPADYLAALAAEGYSPDPKVVAALREEREGQ